MAKVFLKKPDDISEDNIYLISPAQVYGASGGNEVVVLAATSLLNATKMVEIDANVEMLVLSGTASNYAFKANGNVVQVFNKVAGNSPVLIGSVVVQDDDNGTGITFAPSLDPSDTNNVTTYLTIVPKQGGFDVKLGDQVLTSDFGTFTPTTPEPTPEVTPEPTPEVTPEPTPEVTPEPTPEVTPEPTPEVTPEPTPEVTPEPTPEVTPEPTPEVTPEPTPEVTPEPTPEVTPEPTPEVTPEPTPEVTPEPTPEVTPEPTPEVTPEPTPEVTPEPTPEVTPEPTPEVTPEPTPEVTPEPTPEVTPEPTPETPAFEPVDLDSPAGTAQSARVIDAQNGSYLFNDDILQTSFTRIENFGADDYIRFTNLGEKRIAVSNNGADVNISVNDGAGHISQITVVGVTDAEALIGSVNAFNALAVGDIVSEIPTPEVTPEPTPEVTPEPTPEVTPEPTPEVTPEPTPEVTPEPTPEVTPEPTPEVTPEPTPEVTPEPTPEVTPEPTPEVTPEPTPEVTPEPTPEVTPEPTPEVTPEPTPEVTPEPTDAPIERDEVNLDSPAGTAQSARVVDASDLAFLFTDDILQTSFTRIENFGADDAIMFSNLGDKRIAVSNDGADVNISVNDGAGHVSQITVVGVTNAEALIGSVSAFNALSVGDILI